MCDDIQECYESYTLMPDRSALLVRYIGSGYVALLVDKNLDKISRIELPCKGDISDATIKALRTLNIESNITTLLLKESIVERDCPLGVDEELLELVRTVSTSSLQTLADDDSLDTDTRMAIRQVLKERNLI